MALTKEFEYDCEVRGPYKSVQVRKATIINSKKIIKLTIIPTGICLLPEAAPNH